MSPKYVKHLTILSAAFEGEGAIVRIPVLETLGKKCREGMGKDKMVLA